MYYDHDSAAGVDSDDNESDDGPSFTIVGEDGEREVEDEMDDEDDEDNSDEGGGEDPEKGDDQDDSKMDDDFSNGDNTETERASKQKGGTTEQQDESETESVNSGKSTSRPSTPDCDMQPAMDYLLSWTIRKPLMEHSMIEAWANEVVGQS